jgi:predicted TPR repeat methyltransferase
MTVEEAARQFLAAVRKLDTGDPVGAEVHLRRVLLLQPDHAEAHYKLANVLKEQGRGVDAERHYGTALGLNPRYAEAHNNLGVLLQSLGRGLDAAASYRRALGANPRLPQPYLNLGRLLQELGHAEEAQACYREALDHGLDEGVFRHLLVAAQVGGTGQSQSVAAKAPASYVRQTFDDFAAQFDRHLTEMLNYRIPESVSAAVRELSPPAPLDILDLGCGTGLCGIQLKDLARSMTGIDLSPKMLDLARAGGCYTELAEVEIGDYLALRTSECLDLVVAADVFIYIGDLAQVFGETARVLRPGGLFAFSIERPGGHCDSFCLEPSGRYAHALEHVRGLARRAGLVERICRNVVVRKHGPTDLAGELLVLQRPTR